MRTTSPLVLAAMYESLKSRIAALEEEEVFVEEEERRYGARVCTFVITHAHLDHICVVRVLQLRTHRNRFADWRRTWYI